MISEAAHKGDEVSIEVFAEVGEMLGVGIGNYINIFAPDILAVGGQIAKAGKWLLEPAIRTARNVAIQSLYEDCRIVMPSRSRMPECLGARLLHLKSLKWSNGNLIRLGKGVLREG